MDHEVVPRTWKICDRMLGLAPGLLWFTPRKKNVGVIVEFEVFERLIVRPTLSTDMLQQGFAVGGAKEVS